VSAQDPAQDPAQNPTLQILQTIFTKFAKPARKPSYKTKKGKPINSV